MTIKQHGGIFGRNPTFNDVSVETLSIAGTALSSTAAELNFLDGASTSAVVASKAVLANSSGNIAFPSGQGIDFSATSDGSGTTDNELFDDYEEGTWTIECADAASGGNVSATTATGYYTKIGNSVTVWGGLGNISTAGLTSGNVFYIRGLPYTSGQGAWGAVKTDSFNLQAANSFLVAELSTSATVFVIKQCNDNTVDTNTTVADINSGTADIGFTLTYMV